MHEAEAAIVEALADYGQVHEEVKTQALVAYLRAVEAREQIESITLERQQLEAQRETAALLVSYGRTLPRSLLAAHSEIGELGHLETQAREQLAIATAELNSLMNRPLTAPMNLAPRGIVWEPPRNIDQALTEAFSNRFELDRAEAQIRSAEVRKELSGLGDPDIDLHATYGGSGEKNESSFLKGFSVGAVTRFPLAILPLKRARSDGDDAFIRQLELREQGVRNDIGVEVVEAYHRWYTTQSSVENQQLAVAVATEDRRVALAEQEAEVATDPFAVHGAEIEYLRAQRELLGQNYAQQRALVALGGAVGADLREVRFFGSGPTYKTQSTAPLFSETGRRALWVWRPQFLNKRDDAEFFADLMRARGIGAVFLYASVSDLVKYTSNYRRFIALASGHGITVHALNGEPRWILGDHQVLATRFIDAVIAYNIKAAPSEQFAAAHLDIEPHALQGWDDYGSRIELLFFVD